MPMVDASFSMKTIGTARSQRPQPAVEPGVPADLSAAHDEILLHLQPPPQSDLLLYGSIGQRTFNKIHNQEPSNKLIQRTALTNEYHASPGKYNKNRLKAGSQILQRKLKSVFILSATKQEIDRSIVALNFQLPKYYLLSNNKSNFHNAQ